uniref:SWIM-type domain-containing protein n=1 Tax=Nicotiana tabacum TaxID=4097 RepID=A0A1S3X046_TOBAC|nr:PREDICTED: uncharacterized protein LOC107759769 [Nicotiana tabacum]
MVILRHQSLVPRPRLYSQLEVLSEQHPIDYGFSKYGDFQLCQLQFGAASDAPRLWPVTVVSSTKYLHTVNDEGRYYIVCLLEKKGSCGRFQIDELPCPHAWAVLKSKFLMPEGYCSDYYKPKSVVMTYEVLVYPLPDQKEWNIPAYVADEVVLPPKWKRPPGRPKKKRDKPFIELLQKKNQHSCSICGQE